LLIISQKGYAIICLNTSSKPLKTTFARFPLKNDYYNNSILFQPAAAQQQQQQQMHIQPLVSVPTLPSSSSLQSTMNNANDKNATANIEKRDINC
jgi:hypothetical protein